MFEIKILLSGKSTPFHWLQHESVLIKDLQTQQVIFVDYLPSNWKKVGATLFIPTKSLQELKAGCNYGIVTLYCDDTNKSLTEFKSLYGKEYASKKFNIFTRNCTDAANFAIKYFFPEEKLAHEFCCIYDSVCCLLLIGTVGLKYFTPACWALPYRTYEQAKKIEKIYGAATLKDQTPTAPTPQKM